MWPPLGDMLCFDLHVAHLAFGALYRSVLAPLGLTYLQYLVLIALWRDAPLSVGEIGARLDDQPLGK